MISLQTLNSRVHKNEKASEKGRESRVLPSFYFITVSNFSKVLKFFNFILTHTTGLGCSEGQTDRAPLSYITPRVTPTLTRFMDLLVEVTKSFEWFLH